MDILKIFKDNEEMLRTQFCCAFNKVSEIEECYEEIYNPFTKRKVAIFYDYDFFNGNAKSTLNFIVDKMNKSGNRIYRVYEKLDRDFGCMKYKVE